MALKLDSENFSPLHFNSSMKNQFQFLNIRINRKDDKKQCKEDVRRPGFYTQAPGALELVKEST